MLTILTIWAFYMSKKPKCEIETASKWCLLSDSCKESPKKKIYCACDTLKKVIQNLPKGCFDCDLAFWLILSSDDDDDDAFLPPLI